MQTECPEFSASTETLITKRQNSPHESVNSNISANLALDVRQADGSVTTFDILKISDRLEKSMRTIGRDLDQPGRHLIKDICSSLLNTLSGGIAAKGVIDANDLQLQIEMTLRLSGETELVKGYLEQYA